MVLGGVLTGCATTSTGRPDNLREGGDGAVAGSYVVVLSDDRHRTPEEVAETAAELSSRHGGRPGHLYTAVVQGFAIAMDSGQARLMAGESEVAHVQQSLTYRADATTSSARPARPIPTRRATGTAGAGVTAYVLDSGVRATHGELRGRARSGWDFVDADATADDCHGHGTHVAGVVAGLTYGAAPGAGIVAVRVLNCDAVGTTADVLAGIDWIHRQARRPAVVVAGFSSDHPDFMLSYAVQASIEAGIVYVVSAGAPDDDGACGRSPAVVRTAITVGMRPGPDSNRDGCVDLHAPGRDVVAAESGGDTATGARSGTSVAAAGVAGGVAVMLGEDGAMTPPAAEAAAVTAYSGG
jgi:subtilisin family serine protease